MSQKIRPTEQLIEEPAPSSTHTCFYRDYVTKAENPDVGARHDASAFSAPFDINKMHPSQRALLQARSKLRSAIENPSTLAAVLADLVATSHTDAPQPTSARASAGIDMYRATLRDHGFSSLGFEEFLARVTPSSKKTASAIVWIVAGCQDDILLKRRAKAAAEAVHRTEKTRPEVRNIVVFCGAHPPADRVHLTNEAQKLKQAFHENIDSINTQKSTATNRVEIIEARSKTTGENIRNAFKRLFATAPPVLESSSYTAVVVSNDFHLVRLSGDFRQFRRVGVVGHTTDGNKISVTKQEELLGLDFLGLCLLGSENFETAATSELLDDGPEEFRKRFYFGVFADSCGWPFRGFR